jgi:hypothetical protein
MTINGIFSDQAFGPEILENMSRAFESVCEALALKMTDDPVTRTVAGTVIELAQRGVRDVETLRTMALREFNADYGLGQSARLQEIWRETRRDTRQESHQVSAAERFRVVP